MDQPTDGFTPPAPRRPYTIRRMMVHVLIIGGFLGGLAWVGRQLPRPGDQARNYACVNNLKQIGMALCAYESAWGCFPPATVADAAGRPMHSWRVLILPYLDRSDIYKQYHFDEPWDGPNNRRLHHVPMPLFSCPSHSELQRLGEVSYLAVVGRGTLFPGGGRSTRLADVRDGANRTIMVVESATTHIHWMEPRDLDLDRMSLRVNDPSRPGISSWDRDGSHAGPHIATVDDMIRSLPDGLSPARLRALLTIDGGEKVELP